MIKLFTHTDLDGVGCAVLAKLAFGDDVSVTYCGYDTIDAEVQGFLDAVKNSDTHIDMIYITDISVNETVAMMLDEYNYVTNNVRLFDHHKTAEHLNKYAWAEVREYQSIEAGIKTCGTEMFYGYLTTYEHLKPTDKHFNFVWAVTMYDTWMWKEMGEEEGWMIKEFNDLLYILGRDEFIDRCIRRKRVKGDDSMILPSKDERMLLDIRQREIDTYIYHKCSQMKVIDAFGLRCGIVYADRFVSELGNTICEEYPDVDFVAIIDVGCGKVSYRSIKDNVDVGEIAKKSGGGGHKAAAGFTRGEYRRAIDVEGVFYLLHCPEVSTVEVTKTEPNKPWYKRLFGGNK